MACFVGYIFVVLPCIFFQTGVKTLGLHKRLYEKSPHGRILCNMRRIIARRMKVSTVWA